MKNNMYSKIAFLAIGALALATVSCSNDNEPEVYGTSEALPAPEALALTESTYSTLSFEWAEVKNAVQYGCDLKDAEGTSVDGVVTTQTSVSFEDLEPYSDYTLSIYAIPLVGGGAMSAPSIIKAKTPFYPVIDSAESIYQSFLLSPNDGDEYEGVIKEDRAYEGWQEGWFGYFTITNVYNEGNTLTFKVNKNNTITILNKDYTALAADQYNADGWAMVPTGFPQPAKKYLYIEESSSKFDYVNSKLTLTAKLRDTEENTETITW